MKFKVIEFKDDHLNDSNIMYLMKDEWDDFSFKTMFSAYYRGKWIGYVKIAYYGMRERERTESCLPEEFENLEPNKFYSLWTSVVAYEKVFKVSEETGENIFGSLNDIAYNLDLLDKVKTEKACRKSLFREVSEFNVREQLHRISQGRAALTKYNFSFSVGRGSSYSDLKKLSFHIEPNQLPPSNIHAIIGRNGIGKTHLLENLALAICSKSRQNNKCKVEFDIEDANRSDRYSSSDFVNVLIVSLSPFDIFKQVANLLNETSFGCDSITTPCKYIGLGSDIGKLDEKVKEDFEDSVRHCCDGKVRFLRWNKALSYLRRSDLMFEEVLSKVWELGDAIEASRKKEEDFSKEIEQYGKEIISAFDELSSGHKAVLSIISGCVATLEERSLVLIDEPENHLHPPLLSMLIRTLSELLTDQNSVAIIATHSPIVLQEVPKSCVWMLNRRGDVWFAERPPIETFGTNFETLTTQVFGVEVSRSGFHKILQDAVDNSETFEEAKNKFSCDLGDEARGILRILWLNKTRN